MFNPFFSHTQQFEPFAAVMKEQAGQLEKVSQLIAEAQQAGVERCNAALDEWHKLATSSLGYAHDLGRQWRNATLAAAKAMVSGG